MYNKQEIESLLEQANEAILRSQKIITSTVTESTILNAEILTAEVEFVTLEPNAIDTVLGLTVRDDKSLADELKVRTQLFDLTTTNVVFTNPTIPNEFVRIYYFDSPVSGVLNYEGTLYIPDIENNLRKMQPGDSSRLIIQVIDQPTTQTTPHYTKFEGVFSTNLATWSPYESV